MLIALASIPSLSLGKSQGHNLLSCVPNSLTLNNQVLFN